MAIDFERLNTVPEKKPYYADKVDSKAKSYHEGLTKAVEAAEDYASGDNLVNESGKKVSLPEKLGLPSVEAKLRAIEKWLKNEHVGTVVDVTDTGKPAAGMPVLPNNNKSL